MSIAHCLLPIDLALLGEIVKIDLNNPMEDNLKILDKYPVATRLSLTGHLHAHTCTHNMQQKHGRNSCSAGAQYSFLPQLHAPYSPYPLFHTISVTVQLPTVFWKGVSRDSVEAEMLI